MKNCDDMRDYNINGKRKKIINPGLELENNVPTPLTPTPIPIQKRSGFVAPAPPQFAPTITRLGLPQEEIAPIYTQENAKRLRLTKEQQRETQQKNQQFANFETLSWQMNDIAQGTETFIRKDYNQTYDPTVGLQGYVTFGDYYNLIGVDITLYNLSPNISIDGSNYVEYILMRESTQYSAGTEIYPPLSPPTSLTSDMSGLTGFPTEVQTGADSFAQSIVCHFNRMNYYAKSDRIDHTPRTFGLALKGIRMHFQGAQNVNNAVIGITVYIAKDTASKTL